MTRNWPSTSGNRLAATGKQLPTAARVSDGLKAFNRNQKMVGSNKDTGSGNQKPVGRSQKTVV